MFYFHFKGILKLKIKSQKKINLKFILKKLDIRWFSGIEILLLQSAKKKSQIITFSEGLDCSVLHRYCRITVLKNAAGGFPGGAVVESLPANAGDAGSRPGLGRSHMPRSN